MGADLEGHGHQHDEHQQRNDLRRRDHGIEHGSALDAAQHHEVNTPHHHRRADDRRWGVALAEGRVEVAQCSEGGHQVTDVADPGTDPVAPGGVESDVFTRQGAGIGIHPVVQFGPAHGQHLVGEGQHQHAHAGDGPADDDGSGTRANSHVLRQSEDAAAEDGADHQGDQQTHAELAAFSGSRLGGCQRCGGVGQRSCGVGDS